MSDLSLQALLAEHDMGEQAKKFMQSDIGRFMLARAVEEEREAVESLATVWPWRWRRILQLQNKVWRARQFKEWLAELLVRGEQAQQQLEAPEE